MGLALMELCVHRVESVHVCLKSCALFWCELWFKVFLVVIFEEHWEHVFGCLAFGVAHGEHGGESAFGHELVLQAVAVTVASDNTADFPEAEVVKEFTTRDAYLAHEQLVDVVSGGQFFLPPSVACLSFGSPFGIL